MAASHLAEVETLLIRLHEMRATLERMTSDWAGMPAGPQSIDDLHDSERALAQAERLLRRVRERIERA